MKNSPLSAALSWKVLCLIALLLLLDTFAQIFFKVAVTDLGEFPFENFTEIEKYIFNLITNLYVIGGVIALIFALFTWLALISKVNLSFAHPMTSLVYVTIPLCASWLLHEQLSWHQIIGIVIIVVGVFIISSDEMH